MTPLLQLISFGVALRSEGRAPRPLVQAVDMELQSGSITLLLGESGSGKTSLMLGLAGLLSEPQYAHQGTALFTLDGETHSLPNSAAEVRGRGLVVLPQDPGSGLDPAHTVLACVEESLAPSAPRGEAARLLARLGLDADMHRLRTHELSVGMAQRVQLAAAMAARPKLLMLDEPSSALDRRSTATLATLLRELQSEGTSVLLSTHDLGLARLMAGETHVLCGGRVVERGSTADLLQHPRHPMLCALVEASQRVPAALLPPAPRPDSQAQGCVFVSRCALARAACHGQQPNLRVREGGRALACPVVEEQAP